MRKTFEITLYCLMREKRSTANKGQKKASAKHIDNTSKSEVDIIEQKEKYEADWIKRQLNKIEVKGYSKKIYKVYNKYYRN